MISVCIPTFNGEKFIKDQLESILSQLNLHDEVIISDDSSTDNTVNIIKSLNDSRITILENNSFKSPIYNLENALRLAKGDYIFFSDQDDLWTVDKIKTTLPLFEEYDLIVSDAAIIDSTGVIIKKSFFHLNGSKKGFLKNLYNNSYLGCCMAINRKVLLTVLPFPKGIAMHDIWVGLITEIIGKPFFLNIPLVSYRRHGGNLSPSSEKSPYSFYYKIKYRFVFLFNILKRIYFEKSLYEDN